LGAFEPTVLNCFLFRQTDLIPDLAIRKRAATLDFNQQRSARKMKVLFLFRWHQQTLKTMPPNVLLCN
jgi:hypothetical protein